MGYYLSRRQSVSPQTQPPVAEISPTIALTPTTSVSSESFGTLTWYPEPKKISNPGVLTSSTAPDFEPYTFSDLGSYEVGSFTAPAKLIVSFILPPGPSAPIPIRIISYNGKYSVIETLIKEEYLQKDIQRVFTPSTSIISYPLTQLLSQPSYSLNNNSLSLQRLSSSFTLSTFSTQLSKSDRIGSVTEGEIVSVTNPISDFADMSTQVYYLILKDFTLVPYKKTGISFSNDLVPVFTKSDGSPNKDQFGSLNVGCGSASLTTVVTSPSLVSSRSMVGYTNDSVNLFQLTDPNNSLVKYLYSKYKVGRDYPSAPPVLSIEQFATKPNHLLYQDKSGSMVILTNPEYSVQAECGKPVIYLYPQTKTTVSVKVGAFITKSVPQYPQTGWNVTASPSGEISSNDQTYPSLFWEGKGEGLYNSHSGEGFVVAQENLLSTLKSQLSLQGLNQKETKDFLEFWQPRLPHTPYVRLTWLNTADMNELAPLTVSPRPDTTIRVFLEFEGLSSPVRLQPQKLVSPPRRGFTLVEWGGLLLSP